MTKKEITLSILCLASLVALLYIVSFRAVPVHATSGVSVYAPMTSGGVLCKNGLSTLLIATSTSGRNLGFISNNGPVTVFLGFGVPAATSTGYALTATSSLKMDSSGSYAGAVYCMGYGAAASTSYADSNS